MPYAYVVAQVDVKDPAAYEEYKALVPATIAQYGGEYLARGGRIEALEGEPPLDRVVMLRFPSFEQAKAWHSSPEYAGPLAIRHRAAVSRSMLIEGME